MIKKQQLNMTAGIRQSWEEENRLLGKKKGGFICALWKIKQ
ncbi:MAG: hypothetical protein ACQERL_09995 [Bacillota bacterium]